MNSNVTLISNRQIVAYMLAKAIRANKHSTAIAGLYLYFGYLLSSAEAQLDPAVSPEAARMAVPFRHDNITKELTPQWSAGELPRYMAVVLLEKVCQQLSVHDELFKPIGQAAAELAFLLSCVTSDKADVEVISAALARLDEHCVEYGRQVCYGGVSEASQFQAEIHEEVIYNMMK